MVAVPAFSLAPFALRNLSQEPGRFFISLLLCAAAAMTPLQAQTYKWVDERGVVNYSNTPPPALKKANVAQVVEERLSIVPADPSLAPAVAAMRERAARQADYAEAEWLQRYRGMLAAQSYTAVMTPAYSSYGYPYVPVFVARPPMRRPTRSTHRL